MGSNPTPIRKLPMAEWCYKVPCVFFMATGRDGKIYAGVSSCLIDRVSIHKQELLDGYTKIHGAHRLVYYEMHESMEQAILRESRIKKWKRAWKVRLIHEMNPEWIDLFDERTGTILDGPADQARRRG
jgi:putative endonuclease